MIALPMKVPSETVWTKMLQGMSVLSSCRDLWPFMQNLHGIQLYLYLELWSLVFIKSESSHEQVQTWACDYHSQRCNQEPKAKEGLAVVRRIDLVIMGMRGRGRNRRRGSHSPPFATTTCLATCIH
jgi:hypothetical protein